MKDLHVLLPSGVDDPMRPSGGNRYDRALLLGLPENGWRVHEHEIDGVWEEDRSIADASVEVVLSSALPDFGVLLVDSRVARLAADRLAVRARRTPVALLVHSPYPDMDPVLGVASAVIVTSKWTRDRFVGAGVSARRLHVAPPGVDAAPLAVGTPTSGSLLTVGAVIHAKGYDILLRALSMLDDLDWHATWVGSLDRDAEFVTSLRNRVDGSWLSDRIEFTGPMADPQHAYEKADLLVHPTRAESYGMVITEALARGLPVVGSDIGGVSEALGQVERGQLPGHLVPPEDARALSSALRRWLSESWWQTRLRAAARSRRPELPAWESTVATVHSALDPLAPDTVG